VALPGVLLLVAFLVGVTGWVMGHLRTDTAMTVALEETHEGRRVAEAALQIVALALGQVPDWTTVDGLSVAVACPPTAMGTVVLDEAGERAWLQSTTDANSRWGPDTPQWQPIWACHAHALLGRWPIRGAVPSVVVWVADDPEGDGLPLRSVNQRLLLAAAARVGADALGSASLTIARSGPGAPVTLGAWRSAPGS
jgi:hypothetical protein